MTPARTLLCALVNILTRSAVQSQTISGGTGALVRAHCVLASTHAEIVRLVDLTLVNVVASAIVSGQFVASLTGTAEGAEYVNAPLMADSRLLLTLVHVIAGLLCGGQFPESLLAVTGVRTDRIDATGIRRAHRVSRELALVHVLATAVSGEHEARWATANVSTLLVLADLVRATTRLSRGTLVDVNAARALVIRSITTGTVDQVLAAEGTVCIPATLIPATRTLTTFIDIW